jgi:hypothetical protein
LDGDDKDKDKEEEDDSYATTRSRVGELRNAILLPTSDHPTPPSSAVAITQLPTGHKKRKLNGIDPIKITIVCFHSHHCPVKTDKSRRILGLSTYM